MANPWDNTTPVVGNIVRDTVPPELIALKQVNLDRPRAGFLGASTLSFTANSLLFPGAYVNPLPIKIPFINSVLYRGTVNTGEYTCDQSGLYKCEAMIVNPIYGVTNALSAILILEKFTGGAWAQIMSGTYPCNGIGVNPSMQCNTFVALTAGDKIRMSFAGIFSTSQGALNTGAFNAAVNYWYIEFLRSPA